MIDKFLLAEQGGETHFQPECGFVKTLHYLLKPHQLEQQSHEEENQNQYHREL